MLISEINNILEMYKDTGWVLEPDAKKIMSISGLRVPLLKWARTFDEAVIFTEKNGFPVILKVISPKITHKTEAGGVIAGINNIDMLRSSFDALSRINGFQGVLIEKMIYGTELIIGAKIDYQFGPIILIGIGGTGVEIYKDIAMRMAPFERTDAEAMIDSLKGNKIIKGFRGNESVNIETITDTIIRFADLVMQIKDKIQSIDLNPVICFKDNCIIADARIMLAK